MSCFESKKYEIIPTETYKIIRNCSGCGNKSVYYSTNKIRINANGKQIDVWLIYQCGKCKHTYNLSVYSRINRNELDKSEYEALLKSNQEIVKRYGLDRNILQKNAAMIFDEPSYILKDTGTSIKENTIQFSNLHKIKVRHDKLIAECLKISRSQAKRLIESGMLKISSLSDNEVIFTYWWF
jgi:hypothetical protein